MSINNKNSYSGMGGMSYQEQKDIERAIQLSLLEQQQKENTITTNCLTKRSSQKITPLPPAKKKKLSLLDSLPKKPFKNSRPFGGNPATKPIMSPVSNETIDNSSNSITGKSTLSTSSLGNNEKLKPAIITKPTKKLTKNNHKNKEIISTPKNDSYKVNLKVLPSSSSDTNNDTQYVKPHLRPSSAYVPPPPKELISALETLDFMSSDDEDSFYSTSSDTEFKKGSKKLSMTMTKRRKNESGTSSKNGKIAMKSASLSKPKLSKNKSPPPPLKKKANKRKTQVVLLDNFSSPASSCSSSTISSKKKGAGEKNPKTKCPTKSVSKKVTKPKADSSTTTTAATSKVKKQKKQASVAIKTVCKKTPPPSDPLLAVGDNQKETIAVITEKSPISGYQAQRKFAQNQVYQSPSTVCHSEDDSLLSESAGTTKKLNVIQQAKVVPKTEDFLLYLCLRTSDSLPKRLSRFEVPWSSQYSCKQSKNKGYVKPMNVAKKMAAKVLFN